VKGTSLPPDSVVLTAAEAAELADRVFQVRCAAEDVATAVEEGAGSAELRELCEALLRAAKEADGWRCPAPAGMYTAALDGSRASWIVRPDGSVTGVQFNGGITGRDFEQAKLQQLNAAQFQARVRNKRILQQADQSVKLQNGTLTSRINGRDVTAALVTGTTRFG
jgi:ATP-dependent DNA ligase